MSRPRVEHWLAALAVVGAGLLLSAVGGLFVFVNVTTTPIHPDPKDVPSASVGAPSEAWTRQVERGREIVRAGIAEQNLPGVSVAVGVGKTIVWAEGFGWADMERHAPVTTATRFRIGTASKMLTSVAVGLLIEQGRLQLDAPIQTYVPAFPQKPWPVTVRQLMGHVAGLERDEGDEEPVHVHCQRATEALPRFANAPLRFEPGTQYFYSNYGWILVSGAAEAAAGQPFDSLMRRRVFEPLGMNDTRVDAVIGSSPSQAMYYFPRFAANTRYGPQDPDAEDFSCMTGAAAFVSTPSDLVKFGIAMAVGTFLQPATVQLLQGPQRLSSGQETGYGLGWDLETVTLSGRQCRMIGYDGELRDGRVMSFMSVPDHDLVIAVTSNTSYADTTSLALQVAEVFVKEAEVR